MKVALVMCPIWNINEPPLATAYLSGSIKARGHSAYSFDLSNKFYNSLDDSEKNYLDGKFADHDHFNDFESVYGSLIDIWTKSILSVDPEIVCMSLYDSTISVSKILANKIRLLSKNIIIIGGGPSTSNLHDNDYDIFDVMVHGEGEETLLELIDIINSGGSYCNCLSISYKDHDQIVTNNKRNNIEDINSISFPDFDGFDMSEYAKVLPMFTSRGCYGTCTFCAERPQWGRYRFRTAENIVAEMERNIVKYKIKQFNLADSLINGNHHEFVRMCELIIEKKLKVRWGGKARIESIISVDHLKLAYKAGCRYLLYGVESASQRVIDHMGKNIKVTDIERIIKDTSAAKIKVRCFFIVGYINETEEDFKESVAFIRKYHKYLDTIYYGSMLIIKKSKLYENLREYGIQVVDSDYNRWTSLKGENNCQVRVGRLLEMQELIDNLKRNKMLMEKMIKSLVRIKKRIFELFSW